MSVDRTFRNIKSLKIQGAENVSTAAIKAIKKLVQKSKAKTKSSLLKEITKANKKLISARETEPQLENYLRHIVESVKEMKEFSKREIISDINETLAYKKQAKDEIVKRGAIIIQSGDIVYTHCHSSTVTAIIRAAYKKKKFKVYNTETRPSFQGRITSKELVKAKIPVTHFVDSAAKIALEDADIMLIGADSITFNGVYNKVGSEMIASVARDLHVPVYVCSSLWKFNSHRETIEKRPSSEVWKAPKGVKVENYAFEKISFRYIKGIICEAGILRPSEFVRKARLVI